MPGAPSPAKLAKLQRPGISKPKAAAAAKPKTDHDYVALITEAVAALNERSGSSLQAIKRYVGSKGRAKELGQGWSKRLSSAVEAMSKSGKLVKVQAFKLGEASKHPQANNPAVVKEELVAVKQELGVAIARYGAVMIKVKVVKAVAAAIKKELAAVKETTKTPAMQHSVEPIKPKTKKSDKPKKSTATKQPEGVKKVKKAAAVKKPKAAAVKKPKVAAIKKPTAAAPKAPKAAKPKTVSKPKAPKASKPKTAAKPKATKAKA